MARSTSFHWMVIAAGLCSALPACAWAIAEGSKLLQEGIREYKAGRSLEAMEIFLQVLEQDPKNEAAKQYLWSTGKRLREARRSLYPSSEERRRWTAQARIKVERDNQRISQTLQELSKAYSQVRHGSQPATTLAFLDVADPILQKDPELRPILSAKTENMFRQALADIRQGIAKKLFGGPGDLLKAQGYLAYYEKRWPEAVRLWEAALRENSQDPMLRENLARLRAHLEQKQRSEEVQRLEEQTQVYLQSGFYNEAIESWREILRWMPEHPKAKQEIQRIQQIKTQKETEALSQDYFKRGVALYKQEKYVEAIQSWIEALSLNPSHQDARQWLQVVGKKLSATPRQDKLASGPSPPTETASPAMAKDMYRQALIDYSQGHILEAKKLLEETLRLDPQYAQAQKALKRIEAEIAIAP